MNTITDITQQAVERLMLDLVKVATRPEEQAVPATIKAAQYHLEAGGQRVRAKLALHACRCLGIKTEDAVRIAAAVELLHNASLVHDDLQDDEKLRRGLPTVWAAYGKDVAICTGDILLSAAYGALAEVSDPKLIPLLLRRVHERTAMVIQGQCSELSAKDCAITSLSQYESIVIGKSGALLSLPIELAFIAAGRENWTKRIQEAAHTFGVGYQMVDDLEDVKIDTEKHNMNIVLVLKTSGDGQHAQKLAIKFAQNYLDRAIRLAESLPDDSGSLLSEFALVLGKRLKTD
jgi:geranylgeranyl pyrophosphate synthase